MTELQNKQTNLGNSANILGQSQQVINGGDQGYEPTHEEPHINSGQYLKSAVYGGLDGVINSLAVIIGGIGSNTQPSHIIAIGMSVVIGDGIGMGLGDYLSAKSQKQFILAEEQRELWEVDNKLQAEKAQIVQIYTEKQYTLEQSRRLADLFATNRQAFVNVMMLQELGLVVDDSNPMINGVVNFLAFIFLGFIPLIPYFVGYYGRKDNETQYLWTMAIGAVQLFFLGFMKSLLIGFPVWKRFFSGFEAVLLAAIAVAAGFGIGKIFQNM